MPARTLCILVVTTIFTIPTMAAPPPVMEYASVLSSLRVRHATGMLEFEDANHALSAVFLPPGAVVEAVVSQKGSRTALVRQTFGVAKAQGVFNRIAPRGDLQQFRFTRPGDYVLTYLANRKVMTSVPFRVEFEKNDDEFDPKTFVYLAGPWTKWAYMYAPLPGSAVKAPEFRMWANKRSFLSAPDADTYDVELKLNGDVVAVSNTGFISTHEGRILRFSLRHPQSKGGRAISVEELTATDGDYRVVVKRNGDLFGVWPFFGEKW